MGVLGGSGGAGVVSGGSTQRRVGEASERADARGMKPPASVAAALAPATSDVVLVIDDATALVSTPEGEATLGLLRELGLFAGTAIAWNELSGTLGMRPEEALEAIAGRRVTLMIRQETPERPLGWAMVTRVSVETERLLRARLRPVPKRMADGQPVLALEGGRFLLASRVPSRGRDRGEKERGEAVLLVAPADASDFFESCLPLLSDRAASGALKDDPDVRGLTGNPEGAVGPDGRAEAHVYMLYRPRIGQEPDAIRSLIALGATRVAGGWDIGLIGTPSIFGEADALQRGEMPRALFDRASERAVVAIAAPLGSLEGESGRAGAFGRFLGRFLGDLMPSLDGSGLFVLRERALRPDGMPASLELLLGAGARAEGDVPATIDRAMATTIARLSRAGAGRVGGDAGGVVGGVGEDYGGHFPSAVREVELPPRALSVAGSMIGETPVVRWCYAGVDASGSGGDAVWWLAHVMEATPQSDGSTLRMLASGMMAPGFAGAVEGGVGESIVTAGVVRPAVVLGLLPPTLVTVVRPLSPARLIERVGWAASLDASGLVRGGATVRFTADALAHGGASGEANGEASGAAGGEKRGEDGERVGGGAGE